MPSLLRDENHGSEVYQTGREKPLKRKTVTTFDKKMTEDINSVSERECDNDLYATLEYNW